ncbi:MAG: MarR family transcriptional regulator [Chloroflexi bacterium]|nr:MarR family transcriptional regulator [Chloroflexota bacterium]
MKENEHVQDDLDSLIKSFWETFPPIWHATRSMTHQTATEEFGITAAQFHTLRRIWEGKSSVSALAECMHLSRPNISRTVDELVNAGLVERERGTTDRREIGLSLTDKGSELIRDLLEAIGAKMRARFSQIDLEEIDNIKSAFTTLRRFFINQEHH